MKKSIKEKLVAGIAFFFCVFLLVAQAESQYIITAQELEELERVSASLAQKNASLKKRLKSLSDSIVRLQTIAKQKENSLNALRNYLTAYEDEMNQKMTTLLVELERLRSQLVRLRIWLGVFVSISIAGVLFIGIVFFLAIKKRF